MKTVTERIEDGTITYRDDEETRQALYEAVLKWVKGYKLFHGDSIHQTDITYEEAPTLLTELAEEVFRFELKYDE